MLGIGGLEIIFILLVLVLSIIPQILAVLSIARANLEVSMKVFWLIITLFLPFGWLIYFLFGRPKRLRS